MNRQVQRSVGTIIFRNGDGVNPRYLRMISEHLDSPIKSVGPSNPRVRIPTQGCQLNVDFVLQSRNGKRCGFNIDRRGNGGQTKGVATSF